MNIETLLHKMECINAIADTLMGLLEDRPKEQALMSVILDYSKVDLEN